MSKDKERRERAENAPIEKGETVRDRMRKVIPPRQVERHGKAAKDLLANREDMKAAEKLCEYGNCKKGGK